MVFSAKRQVLRQMNNEEETTMKKAAALILCLLMILSCALLSACGSDKKKDLSGSKYVGIWKAAYMSLKDEQGESEHDIFLVLNPDGTAEFTSDDEVSKCTWEETGNGFKLKGDAKMSFTDDGEGIQSTVLGVVLHFDKQ